MDTVWGPVGPPSTTDPYAQLSTRRTPQSRQADPRQVPNSAGGYTFTIDPWDALRRFLTIGTAGGTFYASAREITADNVQMIRTLLGTDGRAVVDMTVTISTEGRAPRQQPQLIALALAASVDDTEVRRYALSKLSTVARTGTALFTFVRYVRQFRGWGPALKGAVADWYSGKPADKLAYQLLKYRQREGWTHRDLLRLSHPKPSSPAHGALYRYATHGGTDSDALPGLVYAFEVAQNEITGPSSWVDLIRNGNGLSWEMFPDAALGSEEVWDALLDTDSVPVTALMRQLPRLTRLDVFKGTQGARTRDLVTSRLTDPERLRKGRVHPINVLAALRTYQSGQSARGSGTWTPNRHVVDALDAAFYAAFGVIEPSGTRTLLALDVSGSMDWQEAGGTVLTPREVSVGMAIVTLATEPESRVVAFSDGSTSNRLTFGGRHSITELAISSRQRLDDVIRETSRLNFGGTDCALPALWARQQDEGFDSIVIYTDNETWAGSTHPHQAISEYRRACGLPVRQIVVGLTATNFTIADPSDPLSLDIAGFDSAVPSLIADFGAGRL